MEQLKNYLLVLGTEELPTDSLDFAEAKVT